MNTDNDAEDEALRQFLGTTFFGKQSHASSAKAQIESSRRIEAVPKKIALGYSSSEEKEKSDANDSGGDDHSGDDDDDDDDDDNESQEEEEEEEEEDDDDDEFPISHELVLKTNERAVTSTTIDPSGARLVTGSTDGTFRLHDFASMTSTTLRSFKTVNPSETKTSTNSENHPIYQVQFNPLSANQLLVVTASPQAKIFNRDGELLTEFVKGDMYLRDMNNTKGHISEITCGAWHPTSREQLVTAGTDSTLRIWDINHSRSQKHVIAFRSKAAGTGGRSRLTAVSWGSQVQGGPNLLLTAALDGTLVMYGGDGPYSRPVAEIRDAHENNTWTSSLAMNGDGRLIASRGGDDTIKLWDARKFKLPVTIIAAPSMSSQYPNANIQFSPSSANLIMGSATGHLHVLNPATLKSEVTTSVTPGSALPTVLWHEKLNQIITGSKNGETHVLYGPNLSTGGAKMVMLKAPKRRHLDDDPNFTMDLSQGITGDSIITPGGILPGSQKGGMSFSQRHPTVGLTASGRSRDPRRPHLPISGPFAKNQPDADYVMNEIEGSTMRDEDPQQALLKYAAAAKEDPIFGKAWEKTQPLQKYAELSDEEEPSSKKVKR